MQKLVTFLMFDGKAREAIGFYASLFDNSTIQSIDFYKAGEQGPEGSVRHAVVSLNGQDFMFIDSPSPHNFSFTASMSIFVRCDTNEEVDKLYEKLSEGGQVFMPLGEYPFSKRYGWVADRYGVAWQLGTGF